MTTHSPFYPAKYWESISDPLNENRFSGSAQIDSSSLGIPLGGEARTSGVYQDIHEHCERRYQQRGKPKCEEYKKVQCQLCPHFCQLSEQQYGICRVRSCQQGKLMTEVYGHTSGIAIDPIEKKPLYHFYPGSSVLSFGTVGCNLRCQFCQNWNISQFKEGLNQTTFVTPEEITSLAIQQGCQGIALTYNEPIIFIEYATDVAACAIEKGLKTIAVTAGYINPLPRKDFFRNIHATNVDLKSFNPDFYKRLCQISLIEVLETLLYLHHETSVWLEITHLIIPDENGSPQELHEMTRWIYQHLGPSVPLHFSAFHPNWHLLDKRATPLAKLIEARNIALQNGLHSIYIGNTYDPSGSTTFCPQCQQVLIERVGYQISTPKLDKNGCCFHCGFQCPGRF